MESGSDCKQGYHSSWFKVGHPGLFASTWNHKSVLQPILRDGPEPVIGRAFARPVGGLLRMRSNLLKHNNLMLRSERRERLEAYGQQATHRSLIVSTRPISGFSWSGMTFLESSSRSISLFEQYLRANASRLSRGKTGTHPSGRGPRACFSGSCCKTLSRGCNSCFPWQLSAAAPCHNLPDIKERGDKHAFSSRGFCTYAAIALAIWDIAGI